MTRRVPITGEAEIDDEGNVTMRLALGLGLTSQANLGEPAGPTIDTAGSLDVSTWKIGTEHTITAGTASASGGGSVSYEYRWLVAGAEEATTAAYTPQAADDELAIAAQWRAVETGGTNAGATGWQTVGSGTVTYPAPVAAGGLADLNLDLDTAMSAVDVSADFTGSDITYALAPSSGALPTGLSLSTAGSLTGTPTEEVTNRSIVVRGTNSGGSDDTAFAITVEAPDTVAPTFTTYTVGSPSGGTVPITAALSEDSTVGWVATSTNQSAATAAAVKTAAEGGTALTDQVDFGTFAASGGPTLYSETVVDGTHYLQVVAWDAAGNVSAVEADGPIVVTSPSGFTLTGTTGGIRVSNPGAYTVAATTGGITLTED